MKDYNEMSDFEINALVAEKLGVDAKIEDGRLFTSKKHAGENVISVTTFTDYCNNQADMWPLIVENNIWIQPDMVGDGYWHSHVEDFWAKDKNPLRAAAIIYLMIKDAE